MKCWRRKTKRFPPCEKLSSGRTNGRRGKSHRRSFTFHAALSNFRTHSSRSAAASSLRPRDGVFDSISQQLPQLFTWFPSEKASARQSQRNGRRTERDAKFLGNISIIILVLNHNCSPNLRLREMKYSTSEGGACVGGWKGNVKILISLKSEGILILIQIQTHNRAMHFDELPAKGVISALASPAPQVTIDFPHFPHHVNTTCHQKSIKSPRYQLLL